MHSVALITCRPAPAITVFVAHVVYAADRVLWQIVAGFL